MKKLIIGILTVTTFLSHSLYAAKTADVRIFCESIQFNKARFGGQNAIWDLELTGIEFAMNGELFPISGARSHGTYLVMASDLIEIEVEGSMLLDVPSTDTNGDGFSDILDTSVAFSGNSSGSVSFPGFFNGNVTANWSRSAGSHVGTCQLNFQNFGSFSHTFTVFEYRGTLTYTPGTNVVEADVNMALTGVPESELKGPIILTKSPTDPYNQLDYEASVWTNSVPEIPEIFPIFNAQLFRDPFWPTNYYGLVEFEDWFQATGERDFYYWTISIDDLNDSDNDNIPDLSDNPQIGEVRRPLLALAISGNELQLTISGDVGQVCQIQQSSTIDAEIWPEISSVTLTNDPQTVTLTLPSEPSFWRVRIP